VANVELFKKDKLWVVIGRESLLERAQWRRAAGRCEMAASLRVSRRQSEQQEVGVRRSLACKPTVEELRDDSQNSRRWV
jgi:hypothetical protein